MNNLEQIKKWMENYLKEKTKERRNMIWSVTHQSEIRKFNIIIGLVILLFVLLQLSMKLH